jgi:hypothetical protein
VRESGVELDGLYPPRRRLILLREILSDDQKVKSLSPTALLAKGFLARWRTRKRVGALLDPDP